MYIPDETSSAIKLLKAISIINRSSIYEIEVSKTGRSPIIDRQLSPTVISPGGRLAPILPMIARTHPPEAGSDHIRFRKRGSPEKRRI
jgi:hypothetical protein